MLGRVSRRTPEEEPLWIIGTRSLQAECPYYQLSSPETLYSPITVENNEQLTK